MNVIRVCGRLAVVVCLAWSGCGTAYGQASGKESLLVQTHYARIYSASIDRRSALHLGWLVDSVVPYYASMLGIRSFPHVMSIHLYATRAEYLRAEMRVSHGRTRNCAGFAEGGNVYIQDTPGEGPAIGDSGGDVDLLLAHELCHAVHQMRYPDYGYLPTWLVEGVADCWAEKAVAYVEGIDLASSPYWSESYLAARKAQQAGRLMPVTSLIHQDSDVYYQSGGDTQELCYAQSYLLIRMLDSTDPSNARERDLFWWFLRKAYALTDYENAERTTNSLFVRTFGVSGHGAFERAYEASINGTAICPWQSRWGGQMTLGNDGSITLAGSADSIALAYRSSSDNMGTRISANANLAETGGSQVHLAFGSIANGDYYMVIFDSQYVTLVHYDGGFHEVQTAPRETELSRSGSHVYALDLLYSKVIARIDGNVALSVPLQYDAGSQWGIGTNENSRVIFNEPSQDPIRNDRLMDTP